MDFIEMSNIEGTNQYELELNSEIPENKIDMTVSEMIENAVRLMKEKEF